MTDGAIPIEKAREARRREADERDSAAVDERNPPPIDGT